MNIDKKAVQAARQVDDTFEPFERTRPIPLFVLAVVFALALWGLATYLNEYFALVRAARTAPARPVPAAAPAPAAQGLGNADPATLAIVGAGKGPAWSCASCHGAAGEGNLSTPRLAGQPAAYLEKQLHDFASGTRANESMQLVANALSDAEMASLARYYAQVGLAGPGRSTLGADRARGEAIARRGDWKLDVPACFSCHGANGEGVAPGFPALAGQQGDYLFAQLAAWHAGERRNSPQKLMDGIANNMSAQDMRSVADYLASLPALPKAAATQP